LLTTVGLGDLYIPPEEFSSADMFSIPFLCLLGFTAVTTFALKLRVAMLIWFPTDQTLELILESRRERIEVIERPRLKRQGAMPTERTMRYDSSDPTFQIDTNSCRSKNSHPTQFTGRLRGVDDYDVGQAISEMVDDESYSC
jgi:hypothetical protein